MPYDPKLVQPMREELTRIGVKELLTAKDVDEFMKNSGGTALVLVNSVCGCAAGGARPGLALALRHATLPDRIATVFAGQDLEATQQARGYFKDVPPSSPSFALMKDGKLIEFVPRHRIEGHDAKAIAQELTKAFDKHCASGAPKE
ncbi:MAG: BrxA/BrxB family bacilliredoxin [Planctomycetota bacterium]